MKLHYATLHTTCTGPHPTLHTAREQTIGMKQRFNAKVFDTAPTGAQEPGMNRPCFLHLDDQRQRMRSFLILCLVLPIKYSIYCHVLLWNLNCILSTSRFAHLPLAGSSPTKEHMPLGTTCNRAKCFGDLALRGDSDDLHHAASLSHCFIWDVFSCHFWLL